MARLAALVPPPRMHLTRFHGVFAPHSKLRAAVTPAHRGIAAAQPVPAAEPAGGRLLPIEVKSTARPRLADAAHLRTFSAEYGKMARAGLLLHTVSTIEWLAPDVLAAPWWAVL